ncbi:hypothetical protein RvY_13913-1 [Ramazzottius varieornatus]|uniref:Protein sleepless n=1 Tax=Ramazzottius varieornatus TaxID=947166 RepID=A0A1D1VPI7_RAMVA|nr:hypothetical protein RvY_13913-1 [Ramazzottius varieornatus]
MRKKMNTVSGTALRCLVAIFVSSVVIESVAANTCYVCNSALDGNCADANRLGNLYRDCSATTGTSANRCIKISGPGTLISRDCASPFNSAATSDGCTVNGNVQTCTCSSNYCNLSSRIGSATGIVSLTLMAGFLLV